MRKHPVLTILTVLLLLFSTGTAESADTLSASLYDPGFPAEASWLYEHEISLEEVRGLFTVPVLFGKNPEDILTVYYNTDDLIYDAGFVERSGHYIEQIAECTRIPEFLEDPEYAKTVLTPSYVTGGPFRWKTLNDFYTDSNPNRFERVLEHFDRMVLLQEETVELEGHPALLCLFRMVEDDDYCAGILGSVLYARNDFALLVSFISFSGENGVSMDDLRAVARLIRYDGSNVWITAGDGEFTIRAEDGNPVAYAGKNKTLTADFAFPDQVDRKIATISNDPRVTRQDFIRWSLVDAETKDPVSEIPVNDQGVVRADKHLSDVRTVEITAESTIFHTKATMSLTVVPAVSGISADREELYLYAGTDTSETVRVRLNPETVPPVGIVWKAQKSGIVDTSAGDDGTAVIRPLAPGKTAVIITEPGGKSARLNVSVVVPVEQVELALSGRPIPGGRVAVKSTLVPKAAGNKKLEWSLNVDESVASVSNKGLVTISREAAAGTKIVVTCKALGAPEPVVSSIEFEVVAK